MVQDQGDGEQPIHYLSHKLSDTQKKWPTVEKEVYAIVYALQKLDHYLYGSKFTVRCDHKPLSYLLSAEIKNRKVQLWSLLISGYNCHIEYIKGKDNEQADFLSKLPTGDTEVQTEETTLKEIGVINSNRIAGAKNQKVPSETREPEIDELDLPDIEMEQQQDPELSKLREALVDPLTSQAVKKRYTIVENILYYLGRDDEDQPTLRLMVPMKHREAVLIQYHEQAGHYGIGLVYLDQF